MRSATLETILDKSCFFGLQDFEKNALACVLPDLQNAQKGLIIELENSELYERNAFNDVSVIPDFGEKTGWKIIEGKENFEHPKEKEKLVNCFANISALKRKFSRVVVINPVIPEIKNSCVAVFTKKDLEKNHIDDLLKLKIAKINIPQTPLFLAAKYAWIFALILCALPFFIPSTEPKQSTNLRNIENEVKKYSEKGDIVHVLKDGESLTQIARFAIGKYNSLVSNESMIKEYLNQNGFSTDSKVKPGDTIRLKLPVFTNPQGKTMQGAWSYFTGLLNDSLAYITELYNEKETSKMRRHEAIDVGARKGTRILAPFSGIAYTMETELGGLAIAIAREKDLLIFMHCDQRFYLNGQTVMEGDPIASVGTSGRTTGPHIHLVAGKIDKKGKHNIGGIKYNILDPFKWYNNSVR